MRVYTITPQPFGEDAVPKEVRLIVATARARGERVFMIDSRPCSQYLRVATRHAIASLKRDGRVGFFVPADRFTQDAPGAAYLLSRDPAIGEEPLLAERCEGVFVVSL